MKFERKKLAHISFYRFDLSHKSKHLKNVPEVFKLESISILAICSQTHLLIVSFCDRIAILTTLGHYLQTSGDTNAFLGSPQ